MEQFRPHVQDFWNACEKIQVVLARREPLSVEEREFIEMACVDLLSKLHEADSGAPTDV